MERRHVESLEELADHYDIVCNCSGFGAKDLCQDLTVTPIRGQVFKVCVCVGGGMNRCESKNMRKRRRRKALKYP